jgi:glycine/D-amino acid oxidase-like deaminating enzyme
MTRYGRSPWIDAFPKSRQPDYERQRGPLTTDLIIVGGGLTGCATAYAFAAAGVKVVLVEADRVGRGSSGRSFGWIGDAPGPSFQQVEKAVGLRAARRAWQAWRRGALDFSALLRRLKVRCDLESKSTLRFARTEEQVQQLKRELKARRDAGVDVALVTASQAQREAGTDAAAAIRTRDGACIDPYRAAIGLAAAAASRGAAIHEQSPATKVSFSAKAVEVVTAGGTIRGDRVVIATGRPTPLFKALIRHFWFRSTYFALTEPVPAKIRRSLGASSVVALDSADPAHHLRWVWDDRLLVAGADGPSVPDRLLEKTIVQRTGQLMYELSVLHPDISGLAPSHGWEAGYGRTGDGLPYIGPHRNFPRHLFAFGCGSHAVTDAYLASRILLRHYQGGVEPGDEVFGFTTNRL